jgi:5'-phosphate synthase pdxT subunit
VAATVGVLALQGGFARHIEALERSGASTREVRDAADLVGLDGLIIPGGESTTISKMLERWDLTAPVAGMIRDGWPVLGTCAGLILLSRHVEGWEDLPRPGGLDITVDRNAYGRQIDSFEADLDIPALGKAPFRGVFIRAPRVTEVGPGIEILASFEGFPVLLRQGRLIGAAFHPELAEDDRFHRWFLDDVVAPGTQARAG